MKKQIQRTSQNMNWTWRAIVSWNLYIYKETVSKVTVSLNALHIALHCCWHFPNSFQDYCCLIRSRSDTQECGCKIFWRRNAWHMLFFLTLSTTDLKIQNHTRDFLLNLGNLEYLFWCFGFFWGWKKQIYKCH